jgi:hypothetical protein
MKLRGQALLQGNDAVGRDIVLTGERAQFEKASISSRRCSYSIAARGIPLVLGFACFNHGTVKRCQRFCQQRMGIR